jgi:hypothetical protein
MAGYIKAPFKISHEEQNSLKTTTQTLYWTAFCRQTTCIYLNSMVFFYNFTKKKETVAILIDAILNSLLLKTDK